MQPWQIHWVKVEHGRWYVNSLTVHLTVGVPCCRLRFSDVTTFPHLSSYLAGCNVIIAKRKDMAKPEKTRSRLSESRIVLPGFVTWKTWNRSVHGK